MRVKFLEEVKIPMIRFLLVLLVALAAAPVRAQTPFYQGKTITIIVGTKTGDAYDLYPRMLAEFMPKYIFQEIPTSLFRTSPARPR